ncbi:MAG: TolC family protein [Bacteroidota bacterium]|jgi:outer membrane protein
MIIHIRLFILFFGLLLVANRSLSQEKWDLQKCVEYAWANNISVQQTDIQARVAALNYQQAQATQYPNVNISGNTGTNFGRSVDPTSNLFINNTLLFQQYNLNVSGLIYNWGNTRNNIISARYASEAAAKDVERIKNDIGLTIATTYLQVLLAKEQVKITEKQMDLTRSRLADTRKRVDAGLLPELNALELEAQFSRDSAAYITAAMTTDQNLLTLKATLNLDAATAFDIVEPPVDKIPVENISELQPELVYERALQTQPLQRVNDLRLKSLKYNLKALKASMYPSLNWFGGLGTNFANPNTKISDFRFNGYQSANLLSPVVNTGSGIFPVLQPDITLVQGKKSFNEMWNGWGTQLSDNFRQNVGLQINIPILNGAVARTNYKRIQYDIQNAEWTQKQSDQRLKNDIYLAYQSAVNALNRYHASKKTKELSEKSLTLAQKRYDAGLLQPIEYITIQNNLFRANIQAAADQFDYVFRMKVLEFYKGMGLRL